MSAMISILSYLETDLRDLTIAGTSFLSTNMLKIWTVMMKKNPMMTK